MYDSVERKDSNFSSGRRLQAHGSPSAGVRQHPPRPHDGETRIAMLEATVLALQFERDSLKRRVEALEGHCGALRSRVETLETTLEARDEQRQQIVQQYERLLAEREGSGADHQLTARDSRREQSSDGSDATGDSAGDRAPLGLSVFDALLD